MQGPGQFLWDDGAKVATATCSQQLPDACLGATLEGPREGRGEGRAKEGAGLGETKRSTPRAARTESKKPVEEWMAAGKGQGQVEVTASDLVCCFWEKKVRKRRK